MNKTKGQKRKENKKKRKTLLKTEENKHGNFTLY